MADAFDRDDVCEDAPWVAASVEVRVTHRRGSRIADLWKGTLGEDTDEQARSQQSGSTEASCITAAVSGKRGTYMSRQVFPQAPSPTMTSLRRISAMLDRCTRQQAWLRLERGSKQDKGI